MLHEVFYWVFNMSIAAALTGLIVLLIRTIRRIPRRLITVLWAIPFLRMAVPVGIDSPYGLMALLSRLTTKTVVVYQPADEVTLSVMNFTMAADRYFPITYKTNVLERVFSVASGIWAVVGLAILLTLVILYGTTRHEMRDAAPLKENIFLSDKCLSPAVYGILRPRIVLPAAYRDKERELVLLHERTHIRRGDNLWRALGFLIVSVHWFNPLAWVFLKAFLADLELSCDECVLKKLGEERAKEYARTLLSCGESRSVFASAFGGAKIRTRIENILSFRKMTGLSLAAFLILIGMIFYVLLTNAG